MSSTETKSILSKRALNIRDSITMAITAKANQLRAEGVKVLSFSAGEPDFDTPVNIKEAGIESINQGKTKYTPASGIIELKTAICDKMKADHDLTYTAKNIVVSCGAKHSIYNTLLAIIDQGEEVIVPSPYWVSYPDQVELVGGKPVIIEATDEANFKITPAQLEAAITPKTKALILNSPSNPTGSVYTRDELSALADVIVKNDILVISDEIYEKLIYDDTVYTSIAEISEEIQKRCIIVNGVSKAYSMTGWRIGYIAADASIAAAIGKIQSQTTSNPTSTAQWAALEAVSGTQSKVEDMRIEFEKRRVVMVDGLNKIPGITCLLPQGAFYTFPNISGLFGKTSPSGIAITSSASLCEALLADVQIACVPGAGFGADQHIRLSYATSEDDIQAGIDRLNTFVRQLS